MTIVSSIPQWALDPYSISPGSINSFTATGGGGSGWTQVDEAQLLYPTPLKYPKKEGYVKGSRYNLDVMTCFRLTHGPQQSQAGKIGIEIECEGADLWNNPFSYWSCKPDGSLKQYKGHSPVEYVLTNPINRDKLPEALSYLSRGLAKTNSEVVDSPRTSVHVHLNQQGKTLKQAFTVLCGYLIIEDLLVRYAGPDREGNTFCLRARDAEYFIFLLEEAIKSDCYGSLVNSEMRYTSCNVASLPKLGTLEFRALRGTIDSAVILSWVDTLLELESICDQYNNPQELIKEIEQIINSYGPEAVVRLLLPKNSPKVLNYPDLKGTLWKAIRRVKDVAYAVPVWKTEVPTKKVVKKFIGVDQVNGNPLTVDEESYEGEPDE